MENNLPVAKKRELQLATMETYVSRDLSLLHPGCVEPFRELAELLSRVYGTEGFRLFEAVRSPQRQRYLFRQEPKVTKADAWQSAHNYGMACDFVWRKFDGQLWVWSWDDGHPWDDLKRYAERFGLRVPIAWDRGHVEHPAWREYRSMLRNIP